MEEFVDDTDNDYLGAILGLAYAWQISDTATLGERLVWNPNFDDSSDWTAVSETSLTASIRTNLAVKLGYLYRLDNRPLEGFDDTDTTTTASLVVSF
jgi:putative salt-induced outer membrane protein YdiY